MHILIINQIWRNASPQTTWQTNRALMPHMHARTLIQKSVSIYSTLHCTALLETNRWRLGEERILLRSRSYIPCLRAMYVAGSRAVHNILHLDANCGLGMCGEFHVFCWFRVAPQDVASLPTSKNGRAALSDRSRLSLIRMLTREDRIEWIPVFPIKMHARACSMDLCCSALKREYYTRRRCPILL